MSSSWFVIGSFVFGFVALGALLSGCHSVGARLASVPEVARPPARNAPAAAPRPRATPATIDGTPFAVLSGGHHAYALLGPAAALGKTEERTLLEGGYALETSQRTARAPLAVTLVGPEGQCVGRASHEVVARVDLGGYSSATLPSEGRVALEVDGCDELVDSGGFLLAMAGSDERARWVRPSHVSDSPAPADEKLGENEVWLRRWRLPESDVEIVERSVLRYRTQSCSEEERSVILVSDDDHPIASYPGFSLFGVIHSSSGDLAVLAGEEDPEALRVVRIGPADARVALDAHLSLFEDTAGGC